MIETLEEGNQNYAELARCFKISRQQIRSMDLKLKGKGNIKGGNSK